MPTIFRKDGFRFFFYSHEGSEPPHVHIVGRSGEMKIWLQPIEVARTFGLSAKDQRDVLNITEENVTLFLEKWKEWHGSNRQKN
ncbi:MAG: DUF4160 domain-containing protein [Bdellovibrio sp.]|nr:MAG: DUF4160 domain-containing protein [Bdellovibrio sp.]